MFFFFGGQDQIAPKNSGGNLILWKNCHEQSCSPYLPTATAVWLRFFCGPDSADFTDVRVLTADVLVPEITFIQLTQARLVKNESYLFQGKSFPAHNMHTYHNPDTTTVLPWCFFVLRRGGKTVPPSTCKVLVVSATCTGVNVSCSCWLQAGSDSGLRCIIYVHIPSTQT